MYMIIRAILKFVFHIIFNYKIYGTENIPKTGGAIIAPNHKSYWDVPFVGIASPRRLRYMAKAELFKNPVFGGFIKAVGAFPVKRGSGDMGAIKAAVKMLENGELIMIFPQGKRVKDGERGKAKQGAALIASKGGASVIPMYIKGEYKFRGRITIRIGKAIDFSEYRNEKLDAEKLNALSEDILDKIYSLDNNSNTGAIQ